MGTRQHFECFAEERYCYLTTVGRVSRKHHEIEIWFATRGSTLYMLSGNRHRSDWVRNLILEPTVSVRLAGQNFTGVARAIEASDPEDSTARTLLFEKYQPDHEKDLTEWRQTALPVAVEVQFDHAQGTHDAI